MQVDDASSEFANPFLSAQASTSNYRADRPDHPSASPTQNARKQRRIDKDRMIIQSKATKEELRGMGMGWEDTENPFIENKGDERSPEVARTRNQGATPDKMTYVLYVHSHPLSHHQVTDVEYISAEENASPTISHYLLSSLPTLENRPSPFLPLVYSFPHLPSPRPAPIRPHHSWTPCDRSNEVFEKSIMDCLLRSENETASERERTVKRVREGCGKEGGCIIGLTKFGICLLDVPCKATCSSSPS